jgi:hypothetical protein
VSVLPHLSRLLDGKFPRRGEGSISPSGTTRGTCGDQEVLMHELTLFAEPFATAPSKR